MLSGPSGYSKASGIICCYGCRPNASRSTMSDGAVASVPFRAYDRPRDRLSCLGMDDLTRHFGTGQRHFRDAVGGHERHHACRRSVAAQSTALRRELQEKLHVVELRGASVLAADVQLHASLVEEITVRHCP